MDGAGFDVVRWDHWLLVLCFLGVAVWGLGLSWQWRLLERVRRSRAQMARQFSLKQRRFRYVPFLSVRSSRRRDRSSLRL